MATSVALEPRAPKNFATPPPGQIPGGISEGGEKKIHVTHLWSVVLCCGQGRGPYWARLRMGMGSACGTRGCRWGWGLWCRINGGSEAGNVFGSLTTNEHLFA